MTDQKGKDKGKSKFPIAGADANYTERNSVSGGSGWMRRGMRWWDGWSVFCARLFLRARQAGHRRCAAWSRFAT